MTRLPVGERIELCFLCVQETLPRHTTDGGRNTSHLVRYLQIFVPGQELFNDRIFCENRARVRLMTATGLLWEFPERRGPRLSWGRFRIVAKGEANRKRGKGSFTGKEAAATPAPGLGD